MSQILDIGYHIDTEGIVDFHVTDDGDLATTGGLESPLIVSLFSDRRAYSDEVADPLRRRGWLGATLLDNRRFGSGVWFYEQARLDRETRNGVRDEAEAALGWMIDENILDSATAAVDIDPVTRTLFLYIEARLPGGDNMRRAGAIADATREGILRGLPTTTIYVPADRSGHPFGLLLTITRAS